MFDSHPRFSISQLTAEFDAQIQHKIDHKTKPLGALGQLESLAFQLCRIQAQRLGYLPKELSITNPALVVFAADHGIARHGISIAPSEVTQQMVANFAAGGAAINVFSRQFGWRLEVVDAGILQPVDEATGVIQQRLGAGTNDFSQQQAMSEEQVENGLELGRQLVLQQRQAGAGLLAFGEMGIGNTSSASAIMAAILGRRAEDCVGRGTGIDEATLSRKVALIQQALELHQPSIEAPKLLLAQIGGFEIVQICGAMLVAAELAIPVVVDGFICTAAAMVAKLIDPMVQDYFIFAHSSNEQGHKLMLNHLEAEPLLKLDLRLGEGSGAALALPLIQAACAFYNDMASFEQAQVEDVVNPA